MRKIETIKLIAGETPMGTLTMATHPPRRKRAVRVLRERDYIYLLRALDRPVGQNQLPPLRKRISGYLHHSQNNEGGDRHA